MPNIIHGVVFMFIVSMYVTSITLASELSKKQLTVDPTQIADTNNAMYMWRYGGPYGYYCGIMHTSKLFDAPIDSVDRACQLHDTCISAAGKYLDCRCNEQLLLRMYDTCPDGANATYYRDQIIRAMNVGTGLCSSDCNLMSRYIVSVELGFNMIPFYGPTQIVLWNDPASTNLVYNLVDKTQVRRLAIDNLDGRLDKYLGDFKKLGSAQMIHIDIPQEEVLFVAIDPRVSTTATMEVFHANVIGA